MKKKKKPRMTSPIQTMIEHHRHRELQTIHCDPPMPILVRQTNLPELESLCLHILQVLQHDAPFTTVQLLLTMFYFHETYSEPPPFMSKEYITDLFYRWIVSTYEHRYDDAQAIKAKLLLVIKIKPCHS